MLAYVKGAGGESAIVEHLGLPMANEDKEKPSNPSRLLGFSGWRWRETPEVKGVDLAPHEAERYPCAFRFFSMRACTSPTSSASVVPVIRS